MTTPIQRGSYSHVVWPLLAAVLFPGGVFPAVYLVLLSQRSHLQLDFDEPGVTAPPLLDGLYASEQSPDGMGFAWTEGLATLSLPELDRSVEWLLTLRIGRGGRPADRPVPQVTVVVDGIEVARSEVADGLLDLRVPVPRKRGGGGDICVHDDDTDIRTERE